MPYIPIDISFHYFNFNSYSLYAHEGTVFYLENHKIDVYTVNQK